MYILVTVGIWNIPNFNSYLKLVTEKNISKNKELLETTNI